jgi:hypothetical protein
MTKVAIEGGTSPMALGIKSMAPIHSQPARAKLDSAASIFVGTLSMISGK